jgi:transposase-like protein
MPKSRKLALHAGTPRWTPAQAEAVLSALDNSGLSLRTFAQREGVDEQRLYFWRRRLGRTGRTGPAPTFVEVAPAPRSLGHVEIVLRSGRVLRAAEAIDSLVLRRLVDALEDEC